MARKYAEGGDYRSAERVLEGMVSGCDTCANARLLLVRVLLEQQRDAERALGLLDGVGQAPEGLILRAEALRGLYRFEEAREYYLQYLALPSADRATAALAHRRLAECQNALQLMGAVYTPVKVRQLAVHRDSLPAQIPPLDVDYQWIFTPSALQSEYDRQRDRVELMAYPARVRMGDRLFFSSRSGAGESLDLWFVRKLEGDLWARPESVGFLLNSHRDESMPLLASDGAMLYFSSEGHYGLGGMDIFRSRWDASAGRWMPPENLGFPYNSPQDDYLLAIPSGKGRMVLATGRGMVRDSLMVYYLDYDPGEPGVPLKGNELMLRYAGFAYDERGAVANHSSFRVEDPLGGRGRKLEYSAPRGGGRLRSVERDPEYQSELRAGHRWQQRADTLRDELTKLREQLWDVRTQEERKRLEVKIAPLEQGMLSAQRKADTHFASASIIEQEYIVGKRTLSSTHPGNTPFADDLPKHLHGAKMAHTAFQPGELSSLAKSFNHLTTFEAEAKAIVTLRRSVGAEPSRGESIESLAAGFTRRYGETVESVRQIYAECLAVALMKSNRHEGGLVQEAERRAQDRERLAKTLRNNGDSSARWRSAFDALLLDAAALQHYERAYALTWGMIAYRQRVEQRIAFYDSLTSACMDGQEVVAPRSVDIGERIGAISANSMVSASPSEEQQVGLWVEKESRYTRGTAIPRDGPLRKGVLYKLQLGAYSNPIDPEIFRGMVPITAETLNGGKITKYYAGEFATKSSADAGKQIAARCGFPDAFVVAWYDGRSVPVARAQSLEGEGEKKPSARKGKESSKGGDTVGYRVVVGVFASELPFYVSETLSILAPGRSMAKQPTSEGQWRYYVPNFQDRGQAERLRDNLLASGYTEASVEEMDL